MSSFRVRFVFNRRQGGRAQELQGGDIFRGEGSKKTGDLFARVLVRQVAVRYAEGLWDKLKTDVQNRIKSDVQRELDHMARMFMYSIVGVASRSLGPRGSLTTIAPASEAMGNVSMNVPVRSLTGNWTPRSHSRNPWFLRQGDVLADLGFSQTWTHAFGGVAVSVVRNEQFKRSDPAASPYLPNMLQGTKGGNTRIAVATIRVEAMKSLTTEMLPALGAGGSLRDYGQGQRVGLLSRLGPDIANRLGGNPARVPFRPTVQPFLAFFLKRQLPNAVFKRLEQGLQGRFTDGTGSAGRARTNEVQGSSISLSDYRPRR